MAEFVAPPGQDESLRRMEQATNYNAWLLDRARPFLGGAVLDAGAGTGTFVDLLARDRELVYAVEPDPQAAETLRLRFGGLPNVVVFQETAGEIDPDSLPRRPDSITDDLEALRRLHDLLVPEGRLLLLVPAHPALYGEIDRSVAHERRYRKRELRRRLVEAGLAVETLRHVNPVGALGWLYASRLRRRPQVPEGSLGLYDRLVPALRVLDHLHLPLGLSLWAVAQKRAA